MSTNRFEVMGCLVYKNTVYSKRITSLNKLIQRIAKCCQEIRETPGINILLTKTSRNSEIDDFWTHIY